MTQFKFLFLSISILYPFVLFSSPNPCHEEMTKYCPGIESQVEKISCLLKKEEVLSHGCKQEIQQISKAAKDIGSRGEGGISSFGGVMGGMGLLPPKKTVLYVSGATFYEGNPTVINQGQIKLSAPVWSNGSESFSYSFGGETSSLAEKQLFNTGEKTPQELHRIELGGQYTKFSKDRSILGIRGSFGSASDIPFYSPKEMTFSLNSFYTHPKKQDEFWVWTVFLSNNNPLLNYIPIPGFMYFYRNQGFTGMFGLPFLSMQWTPKEPWILSLSYFITNLKTEAAYGYRDKNQIYTGFAINQKSYLRHDRENINNRLFFNDKRIYMGYRSPVTRIISAELEGGLSFDRSLREGKRFNDTDLKSDLGQSYFIGASFTFLI